MTVLYSILHFLVDGVCAFAMFGHFAGKSNWYLNILLYNFCAFAMQMPLGVLLDTWNSRRRGADEVAAYEKAESALPAFVFVVSGVIVTGIGVVVHPVLLGLGNALFHLGGGVGTIYEDEKKNWKGRGLGVFVAPGALGLYIGTQLGKKTFSVGGLILVAVVMLLLCACAGYILFADGGQWFCKRNCLAGGKGMGTQIHGRSAIKPVSERRPESTAGGEAASSGYVWLLLGCMAVVVLRSYIGMAVSFPWKTTLLAGTLSVLAVVLGKVAGGFAAAEWGTRRTMAASLLLAAIGYLLSGHIIAGILAQFFFNMTMPITLYLLVQRKKDMPGFGFGALTFAIFLGVLPMYLEMLVPVSGRLIGCMGSMISLAVLWFCIPKELTI